MAGVISNYLRQAMLDHGIGGVAFNPVNTLWVALYLSPPGGADLGLELSPAGSVMADGSISNYNRVSQPNTLASWGATVLGIKTQVAPINIPTQTGTMGIVTSVGWRDQQVGGNLYFSCDLNTPITMIVGSSILFAAGNFSIVWSP